jgi:hypothetical protein
MKSKYLKAFQQTAESQRPDYQLIGDFLLVELIPDDEFKTKSGIILQTDLSKSQTNGIHTDKPTFVRVLMTGEGYFDDSDKMDDEDASEGPRTIPLESQPGDIALVGRTSIKFFSVFGKLVSYGETQLGLCRESDIQMRFKGQEGFDRFFGALNQATEATLEPGQKDG